VHAWKKKESDAEHNALAGMDRVISFSNQISLAMSKKNGVSHYSNEYSD
jgi:hypothetical protein